MLGSRGSSWTSHGDHSLLLPLDTLDLFVLNSVLHCIFMFYVLHGLDCDLNLVCGFGL
jgi:hypothetical protein